MYVKCHKCVKLLDACEHSAESKSQFGKQLIQELSDFISWVLSTAFRLAQFDASEPQLCEGNTACLDVIATSNQSDYDEHWHKISKITRHEKEHRFPHMARLATTIYIEFDHEKWNAFCQLSILAS